jgi:hypothetical protein
MLAGMQQPSLPTRLTRPIGWSGAAAVIAGAALGALVGWLLDSGGCAPAGALGRWLAQAVVHPQMELEGVVWLALLPVSWSPRRAGHGGPGAVRRRGWARGRPWRPSRWLGSPHWSGWWIGSGRWCARGRTGVGAGADRPGHCGAVPGLQRRVVVLLMTPATSRDFRSSRQPLAGTNGR